MASELPGRRPLRLHPLHVESVAWIAERKNVLSTFFLFLTLWAYERQVTGRGWRWYLAVVLFFALGLMAKPMLVTLPFLLLLLDYWPLRRFRRWPGAARDTAAAKLPPRPAHTPVRLVVEKIPLFLLTLASCFVTIHFQRQQGAMATLHRFRWTGGSAMRWWRMSVTWARWFFPSIWRCSIPCLRRGRSGW